MDTKRGSTETDLKESSINPAAAQPAGEWAARQTEGFARPVPQGLTEAGGYIQDAMDLTRNTMAQLRDGPFEQVRSTVIRYTREQPMTALLVAAGAGLLIGILSVFGRR